MEVIEETAIVREELGQPVMATPFSQFVGIQAVLNIVTGERYSVVPDQTIQYAYEHYGPLAAPIQPDIADKIFAQPRAKKFADWERPQPSLQEIRERFGKGITDEELLLRYSIAGDQVDAMLAAGPVPRDPRHSTSEIVNQVADLVSEAKGATRLSVSLPGLSVDLARQPDDS